MTYTCSMASRGGSTAPSPPASLRRQPSSDTSLDWEMEIRAQSDMTHTAIKVRRSLSDKLFRRASEGSHRGGSQPASKLGLLTFCDPVVADVE